MATVVAEYNKVEIDKQLLIEALKGGALGAGVVFGADFLLSKFVHSGKLRAILCTAAPVALAMWLKEKNPELATSVAVGGAGAGIYKLIQAFLYQKLHIPYAGDFEDYGIIEEVPEEENTYEVVETTSQQQYGIIEEVPEEENVYEVVETTPSYGAMTV